MTDDLNALADRCEAATGPDRELDALIFIATVWPSYRLQMTCEPFPDALEVGNIQEPDGFGWRPSPAYTTSLDAALTLVPENWKFRQANFSAPCADERKWNAQLHGGREGEDCFTAFAATPALALCAAALRARAQQEGQR